MAFARVLLAEDAKPFHFQGIWGNRLPYKGNKPLGMGAGNLTCPNTVAFWTQSVRKHQVLRGLTSRSHQLLSLGPPWDPALCGFSGQWRQKLPMNPLPSELLLLPSVPSCPVSPALVTSSCTQDLSLGIPPELLQGLPQGLLGILASDLGLMRGKQ